MKSYAAQVETSDFRRLVLPSGKKLFHVPIVGEIYHLEVDMPDTNRVDTWYAKGTYVFDGIYWNRISVSPAERKASAIGSIEIETETADSPEFLPQHGSGFELSSVTLTPANRRSTFSGTATLWLDVSKSGNVWFTVFRGSTPVALVLEHIEAGKPKSVALTFLDLPFSPMPVTYALRMNADFIGNVYINQCAKFNFDGAAQTAFIVLENT